MPVPLSLTVSGASPAVSGASSAVLMKPWWFGCLHPWPRALAQVKICDFGFATHCGSAKLQAGAIGSPLYMAPELVRNLAYLGPPVDLWALGCVCYELLHGRLARRTWMMFDASTTTVGLIPCAD